MISSIVLYGNKTLRQVSEDVKEKDNIKEIIKSLWDTVHVSNGAGLAAPQLNISKKIFVVNLPDQNFQRVFINPHIVSFFGKEFYFEEGCLSIPSLEAPIKRFSDIRIVYYDENWNKHEKYFSGLVSRVIQHEYDHLFGKLWIDRLEDAYLSKHIIEELVKIKNSKNE